MPHQGGRVIFNLKFYVADFGIFFTFFWVPFQWRSLVLLRLGYAAKTEIGSLTKIESLQVISVHPADFYPLLLLTNRRQKAPATNCFRLDSEFYTATIAHKIPIRE